jgi:hypothetical protein
MNKNFLLLMILIPALAFAQTENSGAGLKFDLPLFDLPYQLDAMNTVGKGFFSSYANPGMNQSGAVALNMFSIFHFGVKKMYDKLEIKTTQKAIIFILVIGLGDFILEYMPGGEGWMHEEYHRAVMSRFGVHSFNGMNLFPLGADIVSVSRVNDEDLIRFKKESPVDFIRMHEAGIEGQMLLVSKLQRNNFFYKQNLPNENGYWMSTLNSHFYIITSALPEYVDAKTAQMNAIETAIAERDFTGFDMTAWVYDLFRPYEPYQNRGPHPSGTGINRYRTTGDLTGAELDYLRAQGWWQIANYVSPMMFGVRSIPLGDSGFHGNFAFRHVLTSFGTDFTVEVYLQKAPFNMTFTLHNYSNHQNYFPAIEAELVDFPFSIGNFGMYLSPRVIIGVQPKNQQFKTASAEFWGLFGLRADFMVSKHFLPYLDAALKTDGWAAGNEFLEKNASVRIGLSMRF